jgi:hypothetical protein
MVKGVKAKNPDRRKGPAHKRVTPATEPERKKAPGRKRVAPATKPGRKKASARKVAVHRAEALGSVSAQVAAAIALALRDEEARAAREIELGEPLSPWTLAARASRMRTRWTN